jgi:hypothetical protein
LTPDNAPVSSGLSPQLIRYIRHSSASRLTIGSLVVCSLLMGGALVGGEMIRTQGAALLGYGLMFIGILIGLIGLLMAGLGLVSLQTDQRLFRDGPLSPGVIVSTSPSIVVALTDLRGSFPGIAYALTQITPRLTGLDDPKLGTRIPCFTNTRKEIESDRFNAVYLHLIPWGTSNPGDLQQCFEKIGEEPFRKLEACVQRGTIPTGDMNRILLDENLEVVRSQANG